MLCAKKLSRLNFFIAISSMSNLGPIYGLDSFRIIGIR